MLPRLSILHAPPLAGGQRSFLRYVRHRRFASTEPPKLVGPMDNAFNRERLAVKHHAAQSAGEKLRGHDRADDQMSKLYSQIFGGNFAYSIAFEGPGRRQSGLHDIVWLYLLSLLDL